MTKEKYLSILKFGGITIVGQFNWGSNFTFLVNVEHDSEKIEAVYKPQRGERPLWDFPADTLAGREVAAFLVSEALGWDLVPPTVFREDGPLGPGSLQLRVAHDPEQHYFTFDEATRQRLRPTALFDLVINNADRKGGHILIDEADKLWLIDHGICFHAEPKLRTVVWDFVGEVIPVHLMNSLQNLQANTDLKTSLRRFLNKEEIAAFEARIAALLATGTYPTAPKDERSMPWPLV